LVTGVLDEVGDAEGTSFEGAGYQASRKLDVTDNRVDSTLTCTVNDIASSKITRRTPGRKCRVKKSSQLLKSLHGLTEGLAVTSDDLQFHTLMMTVAIESVVFHAPGPPLLNVLKTAVDKAAAPSAHYDDNTTYHCCYRMSVFFSFHVLDFVCRSNISALTSHLYSDVLYKRLILGEPQKTFNSPEKMLEKEKGHFDSKQ
jgi:hypothetical protein